MSCTIINHSIEGTLPEVLCRYCHPEYNVGIWAPPKPLPSPPKKVVVRPAALTKDTSVEEIPEIEFDDKPVILRRRPGVISAICEMMDRPQGATRLEIHTELVRRFPNRDPDGMMSTIKINVRKYCTSADKDPKRGTIYRRIEQ